MVNLLDISWSNSQRKTAKYVFGLAITNWYFVVIFGPYIYNLYITHKLYID